jgi:hypothetical protein
MQPRLRQIPSDQATLKAPDGDAPEEDLGESLWEEFETRIPVPVHSLEKKRKELDDVLDLLGTNVAELKSKADSVKSESRVDFKRYLKATPGRIHDQKNLLNPINISPKMFGTPTGEILLSIHQREMSRVDVFNGALDGLQKVSGVITDYWNGVDENLTTILKECERMLKRIRFLERENRRLLRMRE